MDLYTAVSGDDKEEIDNDNVAIPMLMRNALPDVEGYEKNEKLDIALRPQQVSIVWWIPSVGQIISLKKLY